jgi:phosphate transport system ATP-binding protein
MIGMQPKIITQNLNVYYRIAGKKTKSGGGSSAAVTATVVHAVKNVSFEIYPNTITALIGPSGCGKSTLIRTFNRMNDYVPNAHISGKVLIDGIDIYGTSSIDVLSLRRKVAMVFQRPNPFPLSIKENLLYGLKIHHVKNSTNIIEDVLRKVDLWEDLKDKLHCNATLLTLEQQQRLCIARILALSPEIILLDEPCSALDYITTLKIEELLIKLKKYSTIVIVTHNMQQAARISDYCGFMLLGELVEYDKTEKIFTTPKDKRTEQYLAGEFG